MSDITDNGNKRRRRPDALDRMGEEAPAPMGHNQPADPFDEDADRIIKAWAQQRRELHKLQLEHSDKKLELANAKTRIESLLRENSNLQEQLIQSQEREGRALQRIGMLEALMHNAAQSLHEAISTAVTHDNGQSKTNGH